MHHIHHAHGTGLRLDNRPRHHRNTDAAPHIAHFGIAGPMTGETHLLHIDRPDVSEVSVIQLQERLKNMGNKMNTAVFRTQKRLKQMILSLFELRECGLLPCIRAVFRIHRMLRYQPVANILHALLFEQLRIGGHQYRVDFREPNHLIHDATTFIGDIPDRLLKHRMVPCQRNRNHDEPEQYRKHPVVFGLKYSY